MKDSRLWLYDYERCAATVAGAEQRCGVLGVDEAGRGSWVGAVVAAAAYILPEAYLDSRLRENCGLIDDSKKLSKEQRESLFAQISDWQAAGLLRVAAGQAQVPEIEAHNIVGATALAMRRAIAALKLPCELPAGQCLKVGGKRAALPQPSTQGQITFSAPPPPSQQQIRSTPPQVWVDGNPMASRLPFAHTGIVGGDGISLAIAIASIWAKVTRDRLLAQMAEQFPQYGWERNAGYGTAAHAEALRAHGACCHHRPRFLRKQRL